VIPEKMPTRTVVFTDLDGSLLDPVTYSWEEARPALARLRLEGIPVVLVTSKTRAEVEMLRRALDNRDPFIVENGGAAFLPVGSFPFATPALLEWGPLYPELVAGLRAASHRSGCRVRGFNDMAVEEIAALCGFSIQEAALAKAREYDEPFIILDSGRAADLFSAIEEQNLRWMRGGRLYHLCGNNDKRQAVKALVRLYQQAFGQVRSIGIGDGPNDAGFLAAVDVPVLMPSSFLDELQREVPNGVVAPAPGPKGWSAAVASVLDSQAGL
jgi:mannosyl-3-phosphoglycerate phosphatase